MQHRAELISARTTTVHGSMIVEHNTRGPLEYEEAIFWLGITRAAKAPYVGGHCFFSSVALTSTYLSGLSHIQGARIVRLALASVYRRPSMIGVFRNWMSASFAKLQPDYS